MRAQIVAVRAMLVLLCALMLPTAWAGVKNETAKQAYPEEQTIMQVEADSRVPEPGLLSGASGRVHMDRHYLGQYGQNEANVIVQRGGNTWRYLRNGPLATITGIALLAVPLILLILYQAVGPAPFTPSVPNRRIQRFTGWERTLHWATAFSFIGLAVTGLIIMFGKLLLMPWMGHAVFSWFAIISKYLHNVVGPVFIVCSVLMFFTFVHRNFFKRIDWAWIKAGGGLLDHKHVEAEFFNAGEKMWFWFGVVILGMVMSVTGLVLDFVAFGQTRYMLQVANYLHIGGATMYMVAAMGHIYIGTIGSPGSLDSMREGSVDVNWAKAHHSLWYEQAMRGQSVDGRSAPPPAAPTPVRPGPAH